MSENTLALLGFLPQNEAERRDRGNISTALRHGQMGAGFGRKAGESRVSSRKPPALAVAVGGQGVAMPVLTITNQKGGVGKTTTTLNLAAALRERGIRVLAVDFDPQGNLTTSCGLGDADQLGPGKTIADVLLTGAHHPVSAPVVLRDVVVPTPAGVALVPANRQLTTAEKVLYTTYGREFALRDALATLA